MVGPFDGEVPPIAPEVAPNPEVPPSNGDLLQTLVAPNSLLLQTLQQQDQDSEPI